MEVAAKTEKLKKTEQVYENFMIYERLILELWSSLALPCYSGEINRLKT